MPQSSEIVVEITRTVSSSLSSSSLKSKSPEPVEVNDKDFQNHYDDVVKNLVLFDNGLLKKGEIEESDVGNGKLKENMKV